MLPNFALALNLQDPYFSTSISWFFFSLQYDHIQCISSSLPSLSVKLVNGTASCFLSVVFESFSALTVFSFNNPLAPPIFLWGNFSYRTPKFSPSLRTSRSRYEYLIDYNLTRIEFHFKSHFHFLILQ